MYLCVCVCTVCCICECVLAKGVDRQGCEDVLWVFVSRCCEMFYNVSSSQSKPLVDKEDTHCSDFVDPNPSSVVSVE